MGDRVAPLMLRVTTLHASSATATAAYYTEYLTGAPGEAPGGWAGRQAAAFGLSGRVDADSLERLLSGDHPVSGAQLGYPLVDRILADGRVRKAVSGFDATFSAPKSVSVLWVLTGDCRFLEAHDIAVRAALTHLDRLGSTTRIRRDGGRLHPDTEGLTMAVFRQTTSRADDPQIHTHAVISAKVQTRDGRWLALDGRYLKQYQRMLGGLYQSVLRNELTHRLGVDWARIVKGQAEIAGFPKELVAVFSKRAADIDGIVAVKLDEFRQRNGRQPTRFERAALEREAAVGTRGRKSGRSVADLATRWHKEAVDAGWTVERLVETVAAAARHRQPALSATEREVVEAVSAQHSSWGRPDVIQAICDVQRPVSQLSGQHWAAAIERATDQVLAHCRNLDPPSDTVPRRASDGRSEWIEPTAPRYTSEAVLIEEERILTWAIDAQTEPPAPSRTVERMGLDVLQAEAAGAVAGDDRLVLVVGPAGAGKTTMLAAAVGDLHAQHRAVFGVAPTAKAARVLERDTGMCSDTVAKLLHEWRRTDRPPLPAFQLGRGASLVVDEAGMLSTPALDQLVALAEANRWRLVLVGDHRQLQAVGRGGLFAELCSNGRVDELERLHRFTHRWEAAASLQLRSGDPCALDAYEAHDRIIPGTIEEHLAGIADTWIEHRQRGDTVALVASTNDHVDAINHAVQSVRIATGHLNTDRVAEIAGGEHAHIGDVVATRRNDRTLTTSAGDQVRNRETWIVTAIDTDGSLTVTRERGHGTVTLPADYAHGHVRLGYAATEHGYQSDTVDHSISLVSSVTTRRGLYVAATRGRDDNLIRVVTDGEMTEARDILEAILAFDRADIPAVTQRRALAHQQPLDAARRRPAPVGRCEIPEWFGPLRGELRGDLNAAEREASASASQRAQRVAEATDAKRDLIRIETTTAPARDALATATSHYEEARRRHSLAEHHHRLSGVRGRRAARRHLDEAKVDLARATAHLRRTRQQTGTHVARYDQARGRVEEASAAVHRHDMQARLRRTLDLVPDLRRQVEALDTWGRWANGDTVNVQRLGDAFAQLSGAGRGDEHVDRFRTLGEAVRRWAEHAGIDLPTARHGRTLERAGLDIGL